jgi:anhydro-N-acetylmuramic acid kinase
VDEKAVQKILRLPYFKKAPPKSTGRGDFPFLLLKNATRFRGIDLIATATEVTAASIAMAYESISLQPSGRKLQEIYFCGGGAKNTHLLSRIRALLPNLRVETTEKLGIDSQLVEAAAFAYFGYLSLLGLPLGGSWTGARKGASPGWITPGKNWPLLLKFLGTQPKTPKNKA